MAETLVEDMTDVLEELATGTYEIRPGGTPVDDGSGKFTTPAVPAVPDVLCSVQEVPGIKGEQPPEGERQTDTRLVVTAYALKAADTATGKLADQIVIDGEVYEVTDVAPWQHASNVCAATVKRSRR